MPRRRAPVGESEATAGLDSQQHLKRTPPLGFAARSPDDGVRACLARVRGMDWSSQPYLPGGDETGRDDNKIGIHQTTTTASVGSMSRSNGNGGGGSTRGARLELQLNLSPPAVGMEVDGNDDSDSSSPTSCVSSDGRSSAGGSPGDKSPMVIGACTRCLMYCMVAKKDYPTCINCKQPSLVDLLQNQDAAAAAHADADKKRGGKRK
uniref:GIR1-like zinc ribbon domain-containing protein n=1 Tax=Oryza meridionalis TaxID=40149 RepID=A0A0E0F9S8_9ORYZ